MNEELSLERRVELIEKELDIHPSEQDFKDRVQSHRFSGLEFDHYEKYGIAVFTIKRVLGSSDIKELDEQFTTYKIDVKSNEVVVYNE